MAPIPTVVDSDPDSDYNAISRRKKTRSTGDEIRGGFKVPNYVDEIQDFERADAGLMPEKCTYSSLSCTLNWSADRILSGLVDGNSPADE